MGLDYLQLRAERARLARGKVVRETGLLVAFVVAVLVVAVGSLFSYRNTETLIQRSRWVAHTAEVLASLERLMSTVKDSETGQRGYLLTGDEKYLLPYNRGQSNFPTSLRECRRLVVDNPAQQRSLDEIESLAKEKMAELSRTIAVRRVEGFEAARAIVVTDVGRNLMLGIRQEIQVMGDRERSLLAARSRIAEASEVRAKRNVVFSGISGVVLLAALFTLVQRSLAINERRRLEQARAAHDLERQVEERTRELKIANEELEAFSYSVSHDLRAPLRSINGFTNLLEEDLEGRLEPAERSHMDRIRAGTKKMSGLIDDLLALSKVSRSELHREEFDISAMADRTLRDISERHSRTSADIRVEPGLRAAADPGLVQILLENLLRNAWKFSGKRDHAVVEFGTVQAKGVPTFFVRDNGAGFPMDKASSLFLPFQRLHSDKEFEGTGIGLAICHRVVLRHGGEIWAEAEEDKGATFYFTLGPSPES
jgi:signal transduction histidine kinase